MIISDQSCSITPGLNASPNPCTAGSGLPNWTLEAYSTAFCIKLVIARAKFAGSSGKLPSATSA